MSLLAVDNLLEDIYYNTEYSKLYAGDGEIFNYKYSEGDSYVQFIALKRLINKVGSKVVKEKLYDLETPYGYGGPVTNSNNKDFLERAFNSYRAECIKENIVCEFIRFHPFNELSTESFLFEMNQQEREVVVVDLTLDVDVRRSLYSKKTRNIVKRASEKLDVDVLTNKFDIFNKMYVETMKKNSADNFYYFDESYFKGLSLIDGVNLVGTKLDRDYVSIGYFMCSKELAHYHLSANNNNLSKENGNYLLLDSAFDIAKNKGCKYMMLGGGRSAAIDDSLFKFKKKFSPLIMPFYIAGIDFMPDKRAELNALWMEQNSQPYPKLFQLYRA